MTIPASRFSRRATIPALPLAVVGLAVAPDTHAQVLAFDIPDLSTVATNDRIYWDFHAGTANLGQGSDANFDGADFYLKHFADNAVKPHVSRNGSYGNVAGTVSEAQSFAVNFGLNELISAASPDVVWDSSSRPMNADGNASTEWPREGGSVRGYLGLRFSTDVGTTYHYGWAEVTYTDDVPGTLTLHAFGYEQTPDTAITAGAIPEPSTYAALAGLLAGSAALYARRRKDRPVA